MILKRIIASLLSLTILASTLAVPLIYIDFELRQDYIAEVLCINRDKPITVCGGQCYLTSQLEIATDFDNKQDQANQQVQELIFSSPVSKIEIEVLNPDNLIPNYSAQQDDAFYSASLSDVFHPPQVI